MAKSKNAIVAMDVSKMPMASAAEIAAIKTKVGINPPLSATALAVGVAAAAAIKPGKERWPVKTGTDADVEIVKQQIVPATIEELVRAPRPATMMDPAKLYPAFQSKRVTPVETTIWQVEAHIVSIKLEADGDYHVVLQGASGEFLVAEIPSPDPPFVGATSPFRNNIKQARAALDKKFSKNMQAADFFPMGKSMVPAKAFSIAPPPTQARRFAPVAQDAAPAVAFKIKVTPTKVRITGVGFFDRTHGQTGGAPNGIELHPVLSLKFS